LAVGDSGKHDDEQPDLSFTVVLPVSVQSVQATVPVNDGQDATFVCSADQLSVPEYPEPQEPTLASHLDITEG